MSSEEINDIVMRFLKNNGFVILGFVGFGGYETYDNYTDKQVEEAIRHKYVDQIIDLIHKDKAIDKVQKKNQEQDVRLSEIELILTEY